MDADAIIETEVEFDEEPFHHEQERRTRSDEQKTEAGKVKVGMSTFGSALAEGQEEALDETSPLLPAEQEDNDGGEPEWPATEEFAHLPWHKRPSIYWVLIPFFMVACFRRSLNL